MKPFKTALIVILLASVCLLAAPARNFDTAEVGTAFFTLLAQP